MAIDFSIGKKHNTVMQLSWSDIKQITHFYARMICGKRVVVEEGIQRLNKRNKTACDLKTNGKY